MQALFKKLFVALAVIFSVSFTANATSPTPTYARELGQCAPSDYLFGMTPWDCGIQPFDSEEHLTSNVAIIASNVLTDLTVIATYLTIGFTIYGGYLYIFSSGDAGKVASGKKTLTRAFIGLAIVILSNVILNSIRIAFMGSNGSFAANCALEGSNCVDQVSFIQNTLNWFVGTAGAVALIYVLVGGIGYLTSAGDASKLQKSKNTITYALIGLAVVALALVLVNFVSNLARDAATPTSYYNNIIIAKEFHEN